jgi:hypothetical protein
MTETEDPANTSADPDTGDATGTAGTDKDPVGEVEKWKALARKHEEQAKKNTEAARRLAELEDAQKTEQQKLAEQLEQERAGRTAASVEAARYRAAMTHGLSADDLDLLGDDPEQIEARAERLAARFAAAQPTTPSKRPTEALKPGASGQSGDPFEPSALADSIWNKNRL